MLELSRAALGALAQIGCVIDEVRLDYPMEQLWQSWLGLRSYQLGTILKEHHADPDKRVRMKPEACWEVERGARLHAYDLADASVARGAWYRAVCRLFERFDYLALGAGVSVRCEAALAARDRWPGDG